MKTKIISMTILLGLLLITGCGANTTQIATQEPPKSSPNVPTELPATPVPANYQEVALNITMSNKLSYGPILIAEKEGYFAEFGIKLNNISFTQASEALALLVAGTTDIYAGTLNIGFLNVLSGSPDLRAVADRGHVQPGSKCTYQAILVRKDLYNSGEVTSAANLAGQTISVSTGGPAAFILGSYLSQAGLTFKDIKTTNLTPLTEIDAYANKTIAIGITAEPDLTRVLNAGTTTILAKAEDVVGLFESGFIAFGKTLRVDHPDVGARFMAAYLKGVRQYNEGKTDRNLQVLSEATGETIQMLQTACWPSINSDGLIDFAGVEPFQQWAIAQGQLEKPVTADQFFDPSFLLAAQKLLNP
jgi:NitT/TauT family transport system substrate-binding protein